MTDATENTAADVGADENAELAALQMQLAQLETERTELEAAMKDDVGELKRKVAEAAAINDALAKYGKRGVKWELVPTKLGAVLVKKCTAMKYKKFQDTGDFSTTATEAFVLDQVIYPTKPEYLTMIGEQPMIAARCANALSRLAGVTKEDVEKK